MDIQGKKIVVTGAASGIGAACCSKLKARGAQVIGLDINAPEDGLVDDFIEFDQGNETSIDSAAARVRDNVDGLLNVAGVAPSERFTAVDVLRINFFGVRRLTRELLAKLAPGSAIVNMTSGSGASWPTNIDNIKAFMAIELFADIEASVSKHGIVNTGLSNEAAYPFSKQLLSVWTMKMSSELRQQNLRINAVAPAAVETPIVGDFLESFGKEAADRMRGFGAATPEQVANASVFLLTNDANWINGAVIPVDGGAIAGGTMAKLGI